VARPYRTVAAALPLLLSVCTLGCGDGNSVSSGEDIAFDACAPLPLITDDGLTDTESAGVAAAIALWNDRAGTHLTLATDRGAPGLPIHFQSAAPPFHGLYDAPTGQVFINNDLSGNALAITITHEIGHAFGMVHIPTDQRASVMNPHNLAVEPTAEDVATLANRWGGCLASDHPSDPPS
jgi:hypothetical protein